LKGMIMDEKISREMAEAEFERFAACARLDLSEFRPEKDKAEVDANRESFIEDVMAGRLVVDAEGWPTVLTESEDLPQVRFPRRPSGVDRIAMDKCKQDALNYRTYVWVGSVTKVAAAKLSALDDHDWKRIWRVFDLFLAA